MYRKILALLLVCVMLLGIVGCRKKANDSSVDDKTTVATDENGETVTVEATKGTTAGSNEDSTTVTSKIEYEETLGDGVKVEIGVTPSPDNNGNGDDIDDPIDTPTETSKPDDENIDVDINDFVPSTPNGTEPTQTKPEDDDPTDDEPLPSIPEGNDPEFTEPGGDDDETNPSVPNRTNPTADDYLWYIKLSGADQSAFVESFLPDMDGYFKWYNAALAAYNAAYGGEEIGGGTIDGGNIG